MKKIREFTEYVPSWALPYIVNGDNSGLTSDEVETVDAFMGKLYNSASATRKPSVTVEIVPDENEHFSWCPSFGKAGMVTDCTVLFLVPERK